MEAVFSIGRVDVQAVGVSNSWEAGLLTVARRQLQYLRELSTDQSEDDSRRAGAGMRSTSGAVLVFQRLAPLPREYHVEYLKGQNSADLKKPQKR